MWSEWRKDYYTLRYALRRTWWLWGVGVVVVLLWVFS